jgi:hypothetical protein
VSLSAGDLFKDPLPPAEVHIVGHVLHDWGIDAKRALLQRTYDALPEGGAVIVNEVMIDDERRVNAAGLLMSLNGLVMSPDAFDFTGADCQGWMADAGFRDTYFEHLVGGGVNGRGIQVSLTDASSTPRRGHDASMPSIVRFRPECQCGWTFQEKLR